MTKFRSALLVLLAAIAVACGQVVSSEPKPLTSGSPGSERPADQNPAPVPTTTGTVTADGQPVNAMGAATLEFQKRIQAYMKIHNEAESKVPNLKRTDDPVEISGREKALAEMIMTLRPGAQPGEIFAKDYQPYFIKIVQDDFATRSGSDRRALVHEAPIKTKVDINTVYPTTLPLLTFPAGLLRKLPDLPAELEYRIIGRSLILRDVKANLIVDILRDVVPIPT